MTPLVTIGLNTFNAQVTVAAALRSALVQDWPRIEVVVVDDGSSDITVGILRQVAQGHGNVRIIENPQNLGIAGSRNRIIEQATGEFIVFFDDDDISRADRVRRQIERILAYEREFAQGAMVFCHSARQQIYPNGHQRIEHTMGEAEGVVAPSGLPVAQRILFGRPLRGAYGSCASCSQAARTTSFRDLGGFDAGFRRAEDTEFCVRAARRGAHFVGIGETLVTQQMTGGSDKGLENERTFRKAVLNKHQDFFKSAAHLDFCRDWMDLRITWLSRGKADFLRGLATLLARHPIWTLGRLWEARRQSEGNRASREFHSAEETS